MGKADNRRILDMTEAEVNDLFNDLTMEWTIAAIEASKSTDRMRRVFKAIWHSKNGLTCDEVERVTRLPHQTASARMKELRDWGVIERTTETRLTRNKRHAAVHRLSKHAIRALKDLKLES